MILEHVLPTFEWELPGGFNTAKNARSSRKVEENKVTLCGVLSSWNVQK